VVWSIAGSDSGGGAGLQADLKALAAFGVHCCTAVAAITAQNSRAVTRVEPVSAEVLDAQLAALAQDMPPQAIKTGLLGSVDAVRVVCRWVDQLREVARAQGHTIALVVDPVLGATTGAAFANAEVVHAYVAELLPRATLITPNHAEAARLLGLPDLTAGGVEAAARALAERYPQLAVVITGGDVPAVPEADGGEAAALASDWLHCDQARGWLSLTRVDTPHHHGTGCTFAATAVQQCTPKAARALRSACRPAPPPESDPAMLHTTGRLPAGAVEFLVPNVLLALVEPAQAAINVIAK
jgi:hydroxymethylpyrimidine kinase/phosphomethylpyrimidine kinase/thiamine-phosphate diphosphorylase